MTVAARGLLLISASAAKSSPCDIRFIKGSYRDYDGEKKGYIGVIKGLGDDEGVMWLRVHLYYSPNNGGTHGQEQVAHDMETGSPQIFCDSCDANRLNSTSATLGA